MKEPERLRTSSNSRPVRVLLAAGHPVPASHAARARAVAAASAVVATAGLASTTAAAGGVLAKVTSVLGMRWLAVVAVASVGAGGIGVGILREQAKASASSVAGEPTVSAKGLIHPSNPFPPPAPVASSEPTAMDPPAPAASPPLPSPSVAGSSPSGSSAAAPHPPVAAEAPSGSAIRDELAWLDDARAAIRGGDPARGLSLLEGYRARFPRGAMGPEATMLRIEALALAGDRPAAVRAADAFLAANPQSPYAPRVRSLLGE